MKHDNSVNRPMRPMNIMIINVILLAVPIIGDSDNPAVPNADVTSNIASRIVRCGSKESNAIVPEPMMTIEKNRMMYERLIEFCVMRRPRISIYSRPRIVFHTLRNATPNVVVLIPPPVDIGDAPIHISDIVNIMDIGRM
jgi:hypothetical protein